MYLDAVDHVSIGMPTGGEPLAAWFYGEVLGLSRVPAPLAATVAGDCWFEQGAVRVHLVAEDDFTPATRTGPTFAVSDVGRMQRRLAGSSLAVDRLDDVLGVGLVLTDPFGNRLELRAGRPGAELPARAGRLVEVADGAGGGEAAARLRFALELDRLKTIERQCLVAGGVRRENAAEHSWHVAALAAVYADLAPADVDPARAVLLLLVHDIVEIDAGDTGIYDREGDRTRVEREALAADRLFGLLPGPAAVHVRQAWLEYEEAQTPTARFARAFDRLAPFLLNLAAGGLPWRRWGVTAVDVAEVMVAVAAVPGLTEVVDALLADAVVEGVLPRGGSGLIFDIDALDGTDLA